jgi:hypothetical protein
MSYAPGKLLELQAYMQLQTGLPVNSLGIVGDEDHDGGYHCGWDRRNGSNDYSWVESTRDSSHKTDAARAFDCGMFGLLREMSVWMVGQCAAGAPDTLDIREIIYSPDGTTVLRWDRLGIRTSGDSSHQTHTHFSFFADAELRDKVALFRRFFEGGAMAEADRNVNYMIQNGILGAEEPVVHIPAESGLAALELPGPLGIILKALVTGSDAVIPAYVSIPARTYKNGVMARLDALEAKLDQVLATPPGTMNPESIRVVIREELDKTGFREI